MLIPARTDTRYQHQYVFDKAKAILFIKGRLKFGEQKNAAPFPSQLIVWDNKYHLTDKDYERLSRWGAVLKDV